MGIVRAAYSVPEELTYADYVDRLGRAKGELREAEAVIGNNADERKRIALAHPMDTEEWEAAQAAVRQAQADVDFWQGQIDIAHHELRVSEVAARQRLADAIFELAGSKPLPAYVADTPLGERKAALARVLGMEAAT